MRSVRLLLFLRSRILRQAPVSPPIGARIAFIFYSALKPYYSLRAKVPSQFMFDLFTTLLLVQLIAYLHTRRHRRRWELANARSSEAVWREAPYTDRASALEQLSPTLWLTSAIDGANMVVYRIPASKGGGTILHNAVFLVEDQLKELEKIGKPKAIIAPTEQDIPRCMHFASKYPGMTVYMSRMLTRAAEKYEMEWEKNWPVPKAAEESPMQKLYGISVLEPSGTLGHNFDGHTFPAENFYEFPDGKGRSALACGVILCDREHSKLMPWRELVEKEVRIPYFVGRHAFNNPPAFVSFLDRMIAKSPSMLLPSRGRILRTNEDVLRTLKQSVDRVGFLVTGFWFTI